MMNTAGARSRLYYLDWLRVLAMVGIFFFHNARFYDGFEDWHVKNATTNIGASLLVAFMAQWIMPLFFIIAGAGTYYALKSRNTGQFVRERSLRLIIPLVFGIFVIVVPQSYFEAISHGEQLSGYSFLQLYGRYLHGVLEHGWYQEWYHLWFLWILFLCSMVTVPLFFSGSGARESLISRLSHGFDKPWALVPLLVFSIALVNIFLYPAGYFGQRDMGGFNIVAYLLFFIFGYLIFANPRIMEFVTKMRWVPLIAGVIVFAVTLAFFVEEVAEPTAYYGSAAFVIAHLLQALNTWCWLLAILGWGSRYLNRNNRLLSYANEAVLPFYILHQTVIISIGFYVVQWDTGIGLKYLVISTTSFVAIMLIYEVLVRRINLVRFLFGMRRKKEPPAGSARRPLPVSPAPSTSPGSGGATAGRSD